MSNEDSKTRRPLSLKRAATETAAAKAAVST